MTLFLILETTCDETAAAVVTDKLEVRSSVVASQSKLHERYGGVVPEIASRAHLERILPVIDQALTEANVTLADLGAVAVANTPGLAGSLLVGLTAAKTIALAQQIPLLAVNHIHAHVYACRIASGEDVFPCVGLIVSGGHSNLYHCRSPVDFDLLGSTIDDAAGEAFDKVATLLGLGYPGGPAIQKAAERGNPRAVAFPRPLLSDRDRLDFSFSGLKTAVRYHVVGPGKLTSTATPLDDQQIEDVAASFQAAVVDCLVGKSEVAMQKTGLKRLCVGGGVAANQHLRERLEASAEQNGYRLFVPPIRLCTDNAVMGAVAIERFRAGKTESLDLDVVPGLIRQSKAKRG